ncbi:anion exchange protein 3-like [Lethenteron reissneri]|uniref:anion exchange protein 3-like n=1 Tax=Lethenteron reissneri TaxID=7753 RepID=UPI002AB7D722|nr:anion exchange protein 3-like [Lethenteron reissneri]
MDSGSNTSPPYLQTVEGMVSQLSPRAASNTMRAVDEEDLGRVLSRDRSFDTIVRTAHECPVSERLGTYDEADFEFRRHSSHHIHHPLSSLHSNRSSQRRKRSSARTSTSSELPEGKPLVPNSAKNLQNYGGFCALCMLTYFEDV